LTTRAILPHSDSWSIERWLTRLGNKGGRGKRINQRMRKQSRKSKRRVAKKSGFQPSSSSTTKGCKEKESGSSTIIYSGFQPSSSSTTKGCKDKESGSSTIIYESDEKTMPLTLVPEKESGTLPDNQGEWFWRNDEGVWRPYLQEQMAILEEHFKAGEPHCLIGIGGFRYKVDFKEMEQINPQTEKKRRIKRQSSAQRKSEEMDDIHGRMLFGRKRKRRKMSLPGTLQRKLKLLTKKWSIPLEELIPKNILGRGSFGEVRLAYWKDKKVAVKTLLHSDMAALTAFVKEAQLVTRLEHPNIVKVEGLCEDPFGFVFEYAPSSLACILQKKRLNPVQILRYLINIAEGLSYLHGRKPPVIHRDLKPENVLIHEKGHAMLCDFGISREEKCF